MRTYLQKHIAIKKIYKPNYKTNDLNSNNKLKIIDGLVKNSVNESLNRNRLMSRGRGNNEMRLTSCKLRVDNPIKCAEGDFSSIYLKETLDLTSNNNLNNYNHNSNNNIIKNFNNFNNFNNNFDTKENLMMQKLSENFTVKAPQSANTHRRSDSNKGSLLFFASIENNANLNKNNNNYIALNRNSLAFSNESDHALNKNKSGSIRLARNSSAIAPQFSLNNQSLNAVKIQPKGSSVFLSFKKASFVNLNCRQKSDFYKEIEEEKSNQNRPLSVASKFRIDPLISKSASKWVSYKKSKMPKYSSGHFNLPLVSKQLY